MHFDRGVNEKGAKNKLILISDLWMQYVTIGQLLVANYLVSPYCRIIKIQNY